MTVSTPGLGIGKLSQDVRVIDEVVTKGRREMDSERYAAMDSAERGKAEVSQASHSDHSKLSSSHHTLVTPSQDEAVKKLEVQKEIETTLRPF